MRNFKKKLGEKAQKELKQDKFDNKIRLNDPNDRFYKKPLEYALHISEFYECSSCFFPFFGGYVNCQSEQAIDNYDEECKLEED